MPDRVVTDDGVYLVEGNVRRLVEPSDEYLARRAQEEQEAEVRRQAAEGAKRARGVHPDNFLAAMERVPAGPIANALKALGAHVFPGLGDPVSPTRD